MNFSKVSQNKNLFYILLVLTILGAGAVVFVSQYSFLFTKDSGQTASNETIDVASIDIKRLDTSIFKNKKFQSLQKMETAPDNLSSLDKGKRNPFQPD
ncbi:MAG: hypothetical protein NTW06_03955 [Candidatus Falkowbacteria bacterium]|nr:hypothetical protein [Candidatus Falkowbacteria bacterium]